MEKINSFFINEDEDEDINAITDKISSCQDTLKAMPENNNIKDKFDYIDLFYQIGLPDLQEEVKDRIYSPIKETPETFPEVENKNELFKYDLEQCQALKPPQNYKSLIKDEYIDTYEKFVYTVNLLVYIKNLIKF